MLITTTDIVQGREVNGYLAVVTGQTVYGANVFRDLFAGLRDFFGGRAGSYEKVFRGGVEQAMEDMRRNAAELGADAIVGVSVDYESVGKGGSMLMVAVSGTAVKLA